MSSANDGAPAGSENRRKYLLLGFLTLLPLVLFLCLFVAMWFVLSPDKAAGAMGSVSDDGGSSPWLPTLVVGGSMTIVLVLGLQAFYVAHAYRTARPAHRWFWIGFVVIGQLFAMPAYWYFNIWKQPPQGAR